MKKLFNKKTILSCLGIFVFICAFGIFAQTFAQDQYAIQQAQDAVRNKIVRSKGGTVTFPTYSQGETTSTSGSRINVRGYGTWTRNYNSGQQEFSYEARVDSRKNKVDKIKYKFLSDNDGNGRIPNWAIGTFFGRNPQNGSTITLNINSNGNITINDGGSVSYATISGNILVNGGVRARVSKLNNGIRTVRTDTGEQIDYYTTNNNNGNYNNGNANVPNWAVGTFYGRNPQNGSTISLNINSNGRVTVNDGGSVSYATINRSILVNNGVEARVSKLNNGIRLTRTDNGEQIDYYTTNNNNGNYNNGNANVPNWAVGTFYGRNPQNGSTITMTINSNGNVTINVDGVISYATINDKSLFVNGVESEVKKIRNGIRTTRKDNGERIDYRQQ